MSSALELVPTVAPATAREEIRLLARAARRVKGGMRQHTIHLTPVSAAADSAATACRSRGCELASASPDGLCSACQAVYATAKALYRRLVARDLAQMERRTPGIGCAAFAALYERVTRADPPVERAHRRAPDAQRWTPEDWELDRLDAFLAELRASVTAPGEAS